MTMTTGKTYIPMYDPVVFQEGMKFDSECSFCQSRHEGIIFRNRHYWCVRFEKDCGREKILGYTLPQEELEKRNRSMPAPITSNPRKQILHDAIHYEQSIKDKWSIDQEESGRTRQKYI